MTVYDLDRLKLENTVLRKYLTDIHAFVGRDGEHGEHVKSMAACALSGVSGLSMDLHEAQQENDALRAERDQLKQLLDEVVARSILTADELDLMEPPSHAATQAVSRLARDIDAATSILADNDLGIHDTLTLPMKHEVRIAVLEERDRLRAALEKLLGLVMEYSGYYLLDVGADVGAVFSPGIEDATAALKGNYPSTQTATATAAVSGQLEAALLPFAEYAARIDGNQTGKDVPDECPIRASGRHPTMGDCRRAATALEAWQREWRWTDREAAIVAERDRLQAENSCLQMDLQGHVKALALLNAGLESTCEQLDALKQRARKAEGERDRLALAFLDVSRQLAEYWEQIVAIAIRAAELRAQPG